MRRTRRRWAQHALGGLFVEPAMYATEDSASRMRREEVFGPVGAVIRFPGEEDALRFANESEFGLVSGLWTSDLNRARRMPRRPDTGVMRVNTWRAFINNVPFSGVKASGIGREGGEHALDECTETNSAWIGHGS